MVEIRFLKKKEEAWFLDPKESFAKKCVSFEIRTDPLTGNVSRILPYRRKHAPIVVPAEMIEGSRKTCPFCIDQIASSTPKLLPEISSEGRIHRGSAWLFPNAFPYARYNWVIVLCEEHFLYPDQFSVELLCDGFLAAQEGIRRLIRVQPDLYSSINWNYLPSSGAGMFHPHIQIIAQDAPTLFQKKALDAMKAYATAAGSSFWEDYLEEEIKREERYIGHAGNVHFLTAFSPAGIFGEILILFPNRLTIEELTVEDWTDFSRGLRNVFQYLTQHSISFNLSVFSDNRHSADSWVYGRLCPRMSVPPWNMSDINYFEKLHEEVLCVISPEELCTDLKTLFTPPSNANLGQ